MLSPCKICNLKCTQMRYNSTLQDPSQAHDHYALVAQLKVCALQKDLSNGNKFHSLIRKHGLLASNTFVGNTLVHMYAKCGSIAMAQLVFEELRDRTVVSWNALITGYVEDGDYLKAFHCFKQMQIEGHLYDSVTFACILKACGVTGAINTGKEIHAEVFIMGLLVTSTTVGNSLIVMYTKCHVLRIAQQVFEELPARDVVSWNALITGCCQHGFGEEALDHFERMKHEGISPDAVTFSSILKVCGSIGAVEKGKDVHAEIAMQGLLEHNAMLGGALVDMYVKSGELAKAQQLFNELTIHDVVSWTALIVGYCQSGCAKEALDCMDQMKREGLYPDSVTFACILKACGSLQAIDKGRKVHAEVVRKGFTGNGLVLGNALVGMYAKCCELAKAQQLFDDLWSRDAVSWSVLITEYCQQGRYLEAIECYKKIKHDGIPLDSVIFSCLLKACGSMGAVDVGNEIYFKISEQGLLQSDFVLASALVDMYAKCGELGKAQQVFDELPARNVVSWNVLITGYCQHGCPEEALNCYQQMKLEGLSPDAVTCAGILKACGGTGAAKIGIDLHTEIIARGLLEESAVLGSALVDMYAKCGALASAQYVFDKLLFRDLVSWTGLIAGYSRHGLGEEAVDCYGWMNHEGLSPDVVTFASVLQACGSLGKATKGCELHDEIAKVGLLNGHSLLGRSLVDMYARFGLLNKSQEVFDELCVKDVGAWSALMTGYNEHGLSQRAFDCFEQMVSEGFLPDAVIYGCILKSIERLEKGQTYFRYISMNDGLLTSEHHTCKTEVTPEGFGQSQVETYCLLGKISSFYRFCYEVLIMVKVS